MKKLLLCFLCTISICIAQAQNVGVGVPVPTEKLDVNGNIQFNGAIMPSGNAGTAGDALLSNGPGVSPTWGSATQGQLWSTVYSSNSIVLDKTITTPTLIPGLTQSVTIPATGVWDVFIYTDGGAQWTGNTLADNNAIQIELSIWIDGAAVRYTTILLDNTNNFSECIRNWAFSFAASLAAGTHTVEVKALVKKWTITSKTEVTFAAPSVGNYYALSTLSVSLIKK